MIRPEILGPDALMLMLKEACWEAFFLVSSLPTVAEHSRVYKSSLVFTSVEWSIKLRRFYILSVFSTWMITIDMWETATTTTTASTTITNITTTGIWGQTYSSLFGSWLVPGWSLVGCSGAELDTLCAQMFVQGCCWTALYSECRCILIIVEVSSVSPQSNH